jgi:hypothetical protein
MAPSIQHRSILDDVGGLSHLVEAATALTELVAAAPRQSSFANNPSISNSTMISDDEASRTQNKCSTSPKASKKKEIFPQKLMEILADDSLSEIVSWLPHGRSFVIIRPDLFCDHVLPKYLPPVDSRGSTKYPSFTRKLNRW